ncbi:MAG: hypothetical protein AAF909_01490 [Pseudomonadota bacterium]
MAMHGEPLGRSVWTGWLIAMAVAALTFLSAAGPAGAKICDMTVYEASFGTRGDQASQIFEQRAQFIVCATAAADGYVALWDRMPATGPVERLGPSPKFEQRKARPVSAGERICFGDGDVEPGADAYFLLMEASDGLGQGRMWMVYSESLEAQPDEAVFDSAARWSNSFARYGAGAEAAPSVGDGAPATGPVSCDAPKASLNYFYRVVPIGAMQR